MKSQDKVVPRYMWWWWGLDRKEKMILLIMKTWICYV